MTRDENGRHSPGRNGAGAAEAAPIISLTGSTPGGMPLAFNRTPRDALRPWVMRVGVTDVGLGEGQSLICRTLNEHPVLRIIFGARWTAETADGTFDYEPGEAGLPLFFGPNAKHMPLIAHGSFRVVTINFAPGGASAFDLPPQPDTVDRIYRFDPLAREAGVLPGYCPQADKRAWLEAAESQLGAALAALAPKRPEPLMTAFETLCLTDAGGSLDAFAKHNAITRRTLERTINRAWGVTPHEALRRARALDMAAVLLGVALAEEQQDLRLRYFDQSHLIREMRHFFAMTPGQLKNAPCPLLRITMEIRQSRRIEALARIGADEPRPWRDPSNEPGVEPAPNRI